MERTSPFRAAPASAREKSRYGVFQAFLGRADIRPQWYRLRF